ncbi:MAG: DEAD/DEAH box helicase [Anaerolineales bacterium]
MDVCARTKGSRKLRIEPKGFDQTVNYLLSTFNYNTSMSLSSLLSHWRAEPTIGGNVIEWHQIPARPEALTTLPERLHPALAAAMRQRGFSSLYTHQAEVWEHTQHGEHVALVTGTASGKTLAYNLPVLDRLMRVPEGRALYLFPTKALAQDQKTELETFNRTLPDELHVPVGTYDGDTTQSARPKVRQNARIIISNPDMLHTGILPHHTRWAEFFTHLQYVVVDEMHTYRGVFGSHVASSSSSPRPRLPTQSNWQPSSPSSASSWSIRTARRAALSTS